MNIQQLIEKNKSELVTCSPDQTIMEVVKLLHTNKSSALPVCTDNNRLVGVISERDIMRSIFDFDEDGLSKSVRDFMTKDVRVCRAEHDVTLAIQVMFQAQFRHLPVIGDDNECIGFINLNSAMESRLRTRKWVGRPKAAKAIE